MTITLPFNNIPQKAITELNPNTKRPLRALELGNRRRFKPFIDLTGLRCMKWDENKYLTVLDFDYEDKWDNPIFKEFEYRNTYVRETKQGLHLFYMSDKPCNIIQSKKHINVDLRRVSAANPDSWGNHVVLYDLPTNDLPVMEIDFNIVVESLYKQCGEPIRYYTDRQYSYNRNSNYTLTNAEITLYHKALGQYIKCLNDDWTHGYDLSYKLGLQFGTILKDELEAEAVATALMNSVEYPNKLQWVINFVNGFNDSYFKKCYLGKKRVHYTTVSKIIEALKLEYENKTEEYILDDLRQYNVLKLTQFHKIIKEVIQ